VCGVVVATVGRHGQVEVVVGHQVVNHKEPYIIFSRKLFVTDFFIAHVDVCRNLLLMMDTKSTYTEAQG
jgi:hypothetical protein